jgi:hypothetical protein
MPFGLGMDNLAVEPECNQYATFVSKGCSCGRGAPSTARGSKRLEEIRGEERD